MKVGFVGEKREEREKEEYRIKVIKQIEKYKYINIERGNGKTETRK